MEDLATPTLPRVDRDALYLTNAPRGSKPFPAARLIPHTLLRPSPTNPRHWYDQAAMSELRSSIAVHNVQVPLLVRVPEYQLTVGEPQFEIVDGERRWRIVDQVAADGVPVDLPCVVTHLTAEEAQEIQLLSALQRADLHPIDEADSFEALLQDPPGKPQRARGWPLAELAARVGKSTRYIYSRLALCALQRDARAAFYEAKVGLSTAQALARLAPADQTEAVRFITKGGPGNSPLPADDAQQHIQRSYMLRLAQATWLLHDETVLPKAGSCTACPKRTGNSPELFPDLSMPADSCTDRACFQAKATAARQRVIDAAKDRGYGIISGDSAKALMPTRSSPVKGHERLDEPCPELALSNKPLRELLGDKFTSVVLIDNEAIGALVEVAPTAAVKRTLKGKGLLREPGPAAAPRGKAKPAPSPKAEPAPSSPAAAAPAPVPVPAPAPAEPAHAPDEDLQLLADIEDLPERLTAGLGTTPPPDKELTKAQRSGAAIVRSILTACAIGRQMRTDGAAGLPEQGLQHMLLMLLLFGDMHTTWHMASRIAGVQEAPQGSNLRARQAWAMELSEEEACRMVMVALALQEPSGDREIGKFPEQCARALGTGIGHVDGEAQRITRECIQLHLVKHAPKSSSKKGGAK